jgi:hypothetical protein
MGQICFDRTGENTELFFAGLGELSLPKEIFGYLR